MSRENRFLNRPFLRSTLATAIALFSADLMANENNSIFSFSCPGPKMRNADQRSASTTCTFKNKTNRIVVISKFKFLEEGLTSCSYSGWQEPVLAKSTRSLGINCSRIPEGHFNRQVNIAAQYSDNSGGGFANGMSTYVTFNVYDAATTGPAKTAKNNTAHGTRATASATGSGTNTTKVVKECGDNIAEYLKVKNYLGSKVSAETCKNDSDLKDPASAVREIWAGGCSANVTFASAASLKTKLSGALANNSSPSSSLSLADGYAQAVANLGTMIQAKCAQLTGSNTAASPVAAAAATTAPSAANATLANNNTAITKDCKKDASNVAVGEKCTELVKEFGQDYYVTKEKTPDGKFKEQSKEHVAVDKDGNIKDYKDQSSTAQYTTTDGKELQKVGNKFYDKDGNVHTGNYNFTNSEGTTVTKNAKGQIEKETFDDGSYVEYKDGKPDVYKNAKGEVEQGGVSKDKKYSRTDPKAEKEKDGKEDPCKVSTALNNNWRCKGAKTMIDVSNAQAQATQLLGAAGVSLTGNQAVNQYQQSGQMSDAYKGAEKSFKSAKNAQIVTGVVNAAAFVVLNGQKKKMQNNMGAINRGECEGGGCTGEKLDAVAKKYRIKGAANDYEETGKASVDAIAKRNAKLEGNRDAVLNQAYDEQALMEGKTKERAAVHLIQGVAALAQAAKFAKDQKENAKLANRMAELEKKVGTINGNPYVVGRDPAETSSLTGTEGGQTEITNHDPNGSPSGGLGDGLGLGGGGDDAPGLKAGGKSIGSGGGIAGASGGGGGGVGGGGAVAPPDMNEGKAQPAEITEAKDRFEMGGGNIQATGGKSKGGDSGPGLDLGNMLAQFLPKDEPEGKENSNGILSYDGAAQRGIASVEQNNFLDQKTDIFDRLSKKYHGLAEAKRLSAE